MKYQANPVVVDAYQITGVEPKAEDGSVGILMENAMEHITPDMCARMYPSVGDYLVIQSDGYKYLNPKEVFERKYSPIS